MRHGYFIAAICITLSGCAASGSKSSRQSILDAQSRYTNCFGDKAIELTWQPGTPSDLYQVAVNHCKHLRDLYHQELGPYDKLPPAGKRLRDREPELTRLLFETIMNVRRGNIEADIALKQANEKLDRVSAEIRKLQDRQQNP